MGGGSKHVLIATAGHVDHGKTALVRMLTGIETDTLKEERERGLTIDVGFAPLRFEEGLRGCLVDLPGHEKFIRNMVAGASGVDLALLVVAADDSVMPQTVEHLRILDLLGIERGLAAVTRIDLVDDEIRELAVEEVRELLRGTFLEGAPVCPVSSVTGDGFEELWNALAAVAGSVPPRPPGRVFRMSVQRAFRPPGIGTVLTGMPSAGRIRVGDAIELLPRGLSGRVRAVEYHGEPVEEGRAGQCLALSVPGLKCEAIRRGDVAAAPGHLAPSRMVEVRVSLLAGARRPLEHRAPVRLYTGTAMVCGRLHLLDAPRIEPGGSALAQFRGEEPLVAAPGDRFVLGQYSPVVTIGGGRILRRSDRKVKRLGAPGLAALGARERVLDDERAGILLDLEEAGGAALRVEEIASRSLLLEERAREHLAALEAEGEAVALDLGGMWASGRVHADLRRRVLEAVRVCRVRHPRRRGVTVRALAEALGGGDLLLRQVVRELVESGELVRNEGFLSEPGHDGWLTPEQDDVALAVERALAEAGPRPPRIGELAERLEVPEDLLRATLEILARRGLAVRLSDEIYAHPEAEREARRLLLAWLRREGRIGVVDFRDLLGASRRSVYVWLDHFDEVGLTRRVENLRYLRDAAQDEWNAGHGSHQGAQA